MQLEKFIPYEIGGKILRNLIIITMPNKEKVHRRLFTACAIARFIDEELCCAACLKDLTVEKNRLCKEDPDFINGLRALNVHDNVTVCSMYLKPAFAKEEVHEAFDGAYALFHATMHQQFNKLNIGRRLQATVVDRFDFFKKSGSCANGAVHRTNLLGYVIFLLLNRVNIREKLDPFIG